MVAIRRSPVAIGFASGFGRGPKSTGTGAVLRSAHGSSVADDDGPTVSFDDLLGNGQAKPRSSGVAGAGSVQADEAPEDPVSLAHRDARAVVGDDQHGPGRPGGQTDCDTGAGMADGVADQIGDCPSKLVSGGVKLDGRHCAGVDRDTRGHPLAADLIPARARPGQPPSVLGRARLRRTEPIRADQPRGAAAARALTGSRPR
jgi:hypothetical protein